MGPGGHVHGLYLPGVPLRRHCRPFADAKALCVKQGHKPARLLVSGGPTEATTLGCIAKLGAPTSGPRSQALRRGYPHHPVHARAWVKRGKDASPAWSNALIGALRRSIGAGPAADPGWPPDNVCQDRRRSLGGPMTRGIGSPCRAGPREGFGAPVSHKRPPRPPSSQAPRLISVSWFHGLPDDARTGLFSCADGGAC